MSDETGNGLFNPQAQGDGNGSPAPSPETPSAPPEEQGEESQPKFVTEDVLNQRLEEVRREVQSSRDKALSTFDKRYAEKLAEVDRIVQYNKDAQIPMTAEQERALRMKALDEASRESGSANAGLPSGQPGTAMPDASQEQIVQEVNAWAAQQMAQTGVSLEEGDPEMALLDRTSSPDAFKASFRDALYRKRLRMGEAQQPQPNNDQPQGPNPAIPSLAEGGRSSTSKQALQAQYEKEVGLINAGKHPNIKRGDTVNIIKLKADYRRKGLDTI